MLPPMAGEAQVVVRWARLDELPQADDLLTPGELARRDRMAEPFGARWARGRAFVRVSLGEWLGSEAAAVELTADELGRPRLAGTQGEGREISISHSRSVIAVALGSRRLGLDVEDLPSMRDLVGVAGVVASPRELAELEQVDREHPHLLPEIFQRWWVRKEAVLKAQGTGFWADAQQVEVGVHLAAPPRPWQVHDLGVVGGGTAMALATEEPSVRVTLIST